MAAEMGLSQLIVLSPAQHFRYNLFYASTALTVGFYFFIKFVFENSVNFGDKNTRRRQRHILNEQGFTSWSFLYVFGQLTMVLGILFITLPLQFEIDFLREYPHVLLLIPLVLFLNSWPLILRSLGCAAYKWMGYSFLLVSVLSVGFAAINFSDYKEINGAFLARNVYSAYDLQLPVTKNQGQLKSGPVLDFYIVTDSSASKEPAIFAEDTRIRLSLGELENFLDSERNPYYGWGNFTPGVNLHIDEKINLRFVNRIKQELREAGVENILYSTGVKHSRYPAHYPGFKYTGIPETLFSWYPEFVAFLDSAERLDLRKYAIKTPESAYYRIWEVKRDKRITVKATPEQLFLNKKEIRAEALQSYVYKFVKKYSPDYVIIYEADERISYKRYIEIKDLILSAVDALRHERSFELFNQPFDFREGDHQYVRIQEVYPMHVLEWTQEEKRLLALLKKQRQLRESR